MASEIKTVDMQRYKLLANMLPIAGQVVQRIGNTAYVQMAGYIYKVTYDEQNNVAAIE